MHTLESIVYNVLNMASGGRMPHNEYVSPRQVREWVHTYRALYIRRDEDRNRRLREFEQSLAGLTLEVVQADPLIMRTELVLPRFIRLKDNEALNYVGDSLGLKSYQVVDNHSAVWRDGAKYTANDPFAFVHPDGRVYIQNFPDESEDSPSPSPEPHTIALRGIFENPEDVQNFLINQDQATDGAPWHYPLPYDMIEPLVKNILETELNISKASPLDTKQDNLPDHKMPQPQRGE